MSKNFSLQELIKSDTAKKYGINNEPNEQERKNLILLTDQILQPVRDRLGKPIIVTSGFRCMELNKKVGGSKTSQHMKGEAADLKCFDNKILFELIKQMIDNGEIKVGQLINECNYSWVHVSLPTLKRNNQILK